MVATCALIFTLVALLAHEIELRLSTEFAAVSLSLHSTSSFSLVYKRCIILDVLGRQHLRVVQSTVVVGHSKYCRRLIALRGQGFFLLVLRLMNFLIVFITLVLGVPTVLKCYLGVILEREGILSLEACLILVWLVYWLEWV